VAGPAGATTYRFDHLLAADGWLSPGYLAVAADGSVASVGSSEPPEGGAVARAGFALPGVPNLHSHTFQRALAGFAEPLGGASRDFWSWRDTMYDLAGRLDPDDLEAIAAQSFVEMLRGGFTSVAEFHYLHNQADGARYANVGELGERILSAAATTGIGLTLLPALYRHGGVGRPLEPGQRRFGSASVGDFLDLFAALQAAARGSGARVGAAPHSIRAVGEEELREAREALDALAPDAPIHIHVAEQTGEVEESLRAYGQRPAAFLVDRLGLDRRWTLIHCTHCQPDELAAIAAASATVGLCPLSEAHLGDGLFDLPGCEALSGRWGVGTDANTAASPALELRVLEYGQRLARRRRAVHEAGAGHVGDLLYRSCLAGGAAALGQPVGALAPGRRADLLHFEPDAPGLEGHGPDTFLDAWLVRGAAAAPTGVMVAGRWVVREGQHVAEVATRGRFRSAMRRLRA
jgi:formimidoylglutamate deiminase